jgi:hypothetical protein
MLKRKTAELIEEGGKLKDEGKEAKIVDGWWSKYKEKRRVNGKYNKYKMAVITLDREY